jgi:hypothetical protein
MFDLLTTEAAMIPDDAKRNFHDIITHEMFEMDRSLEVTFEVTLAELHRKGLEKSRPAMQRLAQDAVNSLKTRCQFILGQLMRCLASHQVPLDLENVKEAKVLLKDAIEIQAGMVRGRLSNNKVLSLPHVEMAKRQVLGDYNQEGPRMTRRLEIELEIAAASSRKPEITNGVSTMIFAGPVGLVQTGNGNNATVHQHIDTGVRQEISRALEMVLEKLDKDDVEPSGNLAELREMVVEAKFEVEKAEPNSLKLGSTLRTIAETTKFMGSLGPCYQVLKPILSFFGIHLP